MPKPFKLVLCTYYLLIMFCVCASEIEPVLYLSFDDEQRPMQDTAGRHEEITIPDVSRPQWVKDGKFGGALKFDGKDDYCGIKDAPDLNFQSNESFTVELWVKNDPPNNKSNASIIQKGGYKESWDIRSFSEYRIGCFFISNGCLNYETVMLQWGNYAGRWHHLAFVKDADEGKLRYYIDGKMIQEKDNSLGNGFFMLKNFPLILGKNIDGKECFSGLIDELTVSKGVKHNFNLTGRPIEKTDPEDSAEYKPLDPVIEKPNPEIAESWAVLEKYKLSIVPAPKRIKVSGEAFEIDPGNWSILVKGEGLDAGISLINHRLIMFGGKELNVTREENGNGNQIIIGNYNALKNYLPNIENYECPSEQGYIIGNFINEGKRRIVIAGTDKEGTLYGCVTLALLLHNVKKQIELHPVNIVDWPDFKYRVGYDLPSNLNIQASKNVIDYAFLSKQNIVYEEAMYTYVKDMISNAEKRKIISDYAAERGIKVLFWQHASVERAPAFDSTKMPGYSNLYYPYKTEEGLLGNSQYAQGRAFSWSRDDLIDKRGEELSALLRSTGGNIIFLHSMDCGGRENPGNWNFRTPMDKKRWGNDRAAADANLLNRIGRIFRNNVPDAKLIFVEYPYSVGWLKYPEIAEWLKRLSMLMDKEIYFTVREDVREEMVKWMKETEPHPNFIYHEPWPWSYRLFFSCSGRYARTFYFSDRKNDIYQFGPGNDMGPVFRPQLMVAAEYAWNTDAPGWGWFPKDSDSIPRADERVPEITQQLLPRALAIFYGEKAASLIAEAFKVNLSGRLASDLSQFNGAPFLGYFKVKANEAELAVKKLEEAAPFIQPGTENDFNQTLVIFRAAEKVNKAKYMQLKARDLLAEDKLEEAEKLMLEAKNELEFVKLDNWLKKYWVEPLKKELDIVGSIKWAREKSAYLKHIKSDKIKIGVYNQGWYKGIIYGLNKSAGIETGLFEEPDTTHIKKYDVVIFNACKNTGDVYGDWRSDLKKYVEDGGIAIFTHNAIGRDSASSFGTPLFPEICEGFGRQIIGETELTVFKNIDDMKAGTKYQHEYFDHLTAKPGKKADTLIVNRFNEPVMVGGTVGKGYVIYTGEIFGLNILDNDSDPKGDNWKVLFHSIRYAKKQLVKIDATQN